MKNTKHLSFFLVGICISFSLLSCGGDESIENARNDDNGTNISNNGGNGSEALTPDNEKKFIEETSRLFLSYFDAKEFEELSNTASQLDDIDGDALDTWAEDIIKKTLKSTEKDYYTYNYYDALIKASNVKGTFAASYDTRKWEKTGNSDNLVLQYTDKNNAVWLLTVKHGGNVKGKIKINEDYEYGSSYYTRDVTDYYIEIPEDVSITLNRQKEEKVSATLHIKSLNWADGDAKITNKVSGSCSAKILSYSVDAEFDYNPNGTNSTNGSVKKSNATLVKFSSSTKSSISNEELDYVKDCKSEVDILGRIQVHATCSNSKTLVDALEKAEDNDENADLFDSYLKKANDSFSAYITNNGGNKVQATMEFARDIHKGYYGSWYEVVPVLRFADDTYYSFEDYFTESYFKEAINIFEDLIDDFEDLGQ